MEVAHRPAKSSLDDDEDETDDWDTDPDYVNAQSDEQMRWGGARDSGTIDMTALRDAVQAEERLRIAKRVSDTNSGYNTAHGYGGKFGVEKERMDKSAVGHDHQPGLQSHVSQRDYAQGFGGKYGVQRDRKDKSAVGWDHVETTVKHCSQTDYKSGFGGTFGVAGTDKQDKSAVGWDHVAATDKHQSQTDYKVGFGGKFGVQHDRQDASAVGWDHVEVAPLHASQLKRNDAREIVNDRVSETVDATNSGPVGSNYVRVRPELPEKRAKELAAKFEQLSQKPQVQLIKDNKATAPRKTVANGVKIAEEPQARTLPIKEEVKSVAPAIDKPPRAVSDGVKGEGTVTKDKDAIEEEDAPAPRMSVRDMCRGFDKPAQQPPVQPTEPKRSVAVKSVKSVKVANFVELLTPHDAKTPDTPVAATPTQTRDEPPTPTPDETDDQQQVPAAEETGPCSVSEISDEEREEEEAIRTGVIATTTVQAADDFSASAASSVATDICSSTAQMRVQSGYRQPRQYGSLTLAAPPSLPRLLEEDEDAAEESGGGGVTTTATSPVGAADDDSLTAIALYDYQAAADDEISFDPNDIITNIQQVDSGWWLGMCHGIFGLFPANYVQLQ